AHQWRRLHSLLTEVLPRNGFWARKLGTDAAPAGGWTEGASRPLPRTTRSELVADQEEMPPLGAIATYPAAEYVAFHQTSGTQGRPLIVLDTARSWEGGGAGWGGGD